MRKGGYKIIDMGEKAFSPFVTQKVNGAYDAIHGNNRFSVMLSGIVYGGKLLADTMVNFRKIYDLYKAIILVDGGMLCITIDENDIVTVKPLQRTTAVQATTETAGLIKQIEHQPNATPATEDEEKTAPTVAEYNDLVEKYNNLLDAMVDAEVMEEAPPTPSLIPLAVGDVVVSGTTKVKVDKTQDIDTILDTLTEGEGPLFNLAVFEEVGGQQNSCVIAIKIGTLKAIGIADSNSPTGKILYATEAMPDIGITQGWQNLDENDEATFGLSGTIDTISQGSVWNGVVIGKVS